MAVSARAEAPDENRRSPEQVADGSAHGEISDVMLNLEHTIARTQKALVRVKKSGSDNNAELALIDVIADLERSHKRLIQDTHYSGDSLRLI